MTDEIQKLPVSTQRILRESQNHVPPMLQTTRLIYQAIQERHHYLFIPNWSPNLLMHSVDQDQSFFCWSPHIRAYYLNEISFLIVDGRTSLQKVCCGEQHPVFMRRGKSSGQIRVSQFIQCCLPYCCCESQINESLDCSFQVIDQKGKVVLSFRKATGYCELCRKWAYILYEGEAGHLFGKVSCDDTLKRRLQNKKQMEVDIAIQNILLNRRIIQYLFTGLVYLGSK